MVPYAWNLELPECDWELINYLIQFIFNNDLKFWCLIKMLILIVLFSSCTWLLSRIQTDTMTVLTSGAMFMELIVSDVLVDIDGIPDCYEDLEINSCADLKTRIAYFSA